MKKGHNESLILAVCILVLLVAACKMGRKTGTLPITNNSRQQNQATPDELTSRRFAIYYFKEKAKVIWQSSTTTELNPKTRIKGKIALVWRSTNGNISMPLFEDKESKIDTSQLEHYGFKEQEIAISAEEIDTLIKVGCEKGDQIGEYQITGFSRIIPAYAMKCKTEIVDYRTHTTFAEREIVNQKMEKSIKTDFNSGGHILRPPFDQIRNYLKTLRGK